MIILCACNSAAQENWLRRAGGTGLDEALDIALHPSDGGYYVTGHFSGNSNFSIQTLVSSGLSDGFIARYDDEGTPLWALKFGGPQNDRSNAIAVDEDGNAYITGFFQGTATFGTWSVSAADSGDVFIARISPFGNVDWVTQAGGEYNDSGNGIDIRNGIIAVAGQFRGQGSFGPFTLSSMNGGMGNQPTSDVFIATLTADGNWNWIQQGAGAQEDKANDVAMAPDGSVYACGQFSGDITFDQLYDNTVQNAGFLIRLNSTGAEQWVSSIYASLVAPNDVETDASGNVFLTGESIGQLIFNGTNSLTVPVTWTYSFFLARYNPSGNVIWATEDGSQNTVSARGMDLREDELFVTGTFTCSFSEYAEELGEGRFLSVGYRDVFVSRFLTDGTRTDIYNFGGPRDEFCQGVAAGLTDNSPRIAGSFEKFFHVPTDEAYIDNSTLWTNPNNIIVDPPDQPAGPFCGSGYSGAFLTVEAIGGKDVFISHPVDPDVAPYDFFARAGDCTYDIIDGCIGLAPGDLICSPDTTVCGNASLYVNFNTGSNGYIGPEYQWEWNNGSSANPLSVSSSGTYTVEISRLDGCYESDDEITIEVLPLPVPLITDDEGINLESPPIAEDINLCAPDEVLLTASGTPDQTIVSWTGPDFGPVYDTDLLVTESGNYTVMAEDEFGCIGSNYVQVNIIEGLDTIQPALEFTGENVPVNDTLILCESDELMIDLLDLLQQEDFEDATDALWQLYLDGQLIQELESTTYFSYEPTQSGWYTISSVPFTFIPPPCTEDTLYYPELSLEVYVEILPAPPVNPYITGPTLFCPGDTLLLVASNAPNYGWGGSGIIEILSSDSVLVNTAGNYSVTSTILYPNGCSVYGSDNHTISLIPSPQIISDPDWSVICPGDSILLTCEPGDEYLWIGPLGQPLGTGQSIWVSSPGDYYCLMTNEGCALESNFIEALQYSSPYLIAFPNGNLCANGFVNLIAQSQPGSTITWLPPLSGNSSSIAVFEPDTYYAEIESCGITTTVSLEVIEGSPVVNISASSDMICPGQSVILTATPGFSSYTWQPDGGNSNQLLVTEAGTYSVVASDGDCEGESTIVEIEESTLQAPIANDVSVCVGEDATLNALGGSGVFWAASSSGTPVLDNDNTYSIDNVTESSQVYVFSDDGVCTSLPELVNINVYASSLLSIEASDTAFCAGESLVLETQDLTTPGADYTWIWPDGTITSQPVISIETASPSQSGWFYLSGNDIFCSSADSIFILIENPWDTSLLTEEDVAVCTGSELILEANTNSGQVNWQTPVGEFTGQVLMIEETDASHAGAYSVSVPGNYCPQQSDTAWAVIVEYPEIDLVDSLIYCDGGYMTVHLPGGYDAYLWSDGTTEPEAVVPLSGYVWVEVTNHPGCSTRDSIYYPDVDCIVDFPNVFTPNQDGTNEFIDFGILRIPIDEVLIFNRWGMVVRRLTTRPWKWDGKADTGEYVVDGVYYYIVKSPAPGKQFHNIEGYIHVLR